MLHDMLTSRVLGSSNRVSKFAVLLPRLLSTMSGNKTAVVLVADGSEEMEAVITIDVLRRAGVDVTVAAVGDTQTVKCSRGVNILADCTMTSVSTLNRDFDAVILPGGDYRN